MTDNRCKSKSVQSFSRTARIALNYICAFPSAKSPAHSTGGVVVLTDLRDVVSSPVPLLSSKHRGSCPSRCFCQTLLYQLHLEIKSQYRWVGRVWHKKKQYSAMRTSLPALPSATVKVECVGHILFQQFLLVKKGGTIY